MTFQNTFSQPNKRLMYHFGRKIVFSLILLKVSTCLLAQSITSIKGNVVDADGTPQFGNVLLLSATDSSIVTGTSFLEGAFELNNINTKQALLKITSLAFKEQFLQLNYQGTSQVNIGEVMVEVETLEEVEIAAKRPLLLERPDGSVEITVANTTLATSTSVNEILTRSPGIVTDEDNNIQIFGKGAAIIFLNNVRVSNDRLSTLSPSDIEKIEIISNPGPRYDAEGNAVIHITTKRAVDEGAKGTIKNYLSHSNFAGVDNRTNLDYSYTKGKWAINGNYGLAVGKDRERLSTTRTRNIAEDFFSSDLTTDWQYALENFSNYGLGVQYNVSPKTYWSLQYTGAYEDLGGQQLSDNAITFEGTTNFYDSQVNWNEQTQKDAFNLNFVTDTDEQGSNLFVGGQYASYLHNFDNDINEQNLVDNIERNTFINNSGRSDIAIISIQVDYTKVFAQGYTLELGGKWGYVNNVSFTDFFDIDTDGTRTKNEAISNTYEYVEQIPAGYVNFKGSFSKKLNYQIGTRIELTDYTLLSNVDEGIRLEDRYLNIFPNAGLFLKIQEETNAYFTYASRINRPSYQSLNPFVIYQDPFTSIQGNPNIQPAKVHALELGGRHQDWSVKTGYNFTLDIIQGGAFQAPEDPRAYVLQRVNISQQHSFFASVSRQVNLNWWSSTNTASVSYNDQIDGLGIFGQRANQPFYYLYSQNSIDIPNLVRIYATAWYVSDKQDGVYLRENSASVNLGLERKFFQGAITCNLDFNDIFYQVRAAGEYRLGVTDIIYGRVYNTNYIRWSLAYNCGRLRKSTFKNKNVGESELQRAQ